MTVGQQRWVSLDVGSNELAVSVTAADGTLQEYTVTVERAAARIDATLASLSATGVDFGTFDSATTSYQASADHATTAVTVTAAPSDSVAAVTITPADADRAAPGHQVELPVGVTAVQTTVTAQDGITQRIYTVSVTRAAAGATLNALGTDGADIGTFASDRFSYSASVPHGTAVVTLRPTTSSSSAVITYSSVDSDPVASGHQVALAEGRNRFTITVTDGSFSGVYTLAILRDEVVQVPDSVLASAIRSELGKPASESLYASDLASLSTLGIAGEGISSLEGLEHATNLESLSAGYNSISDLMPLAGLVSLRKLWINSNQVTSLEPLRALTQLRSLHIQRLRQTDLSFLSGYTSLQTLYLGFGEVRDLAPLAELPSLRSLWVVGAGVTDISPLSRLSELNKVSLEANGIDDLTPLAGLEELNEVQLRYNRVADVGPLSEFANPGKIDLRANRVTNLASLLERTSWPQRQGQRPSLDVRENSLSAVSIAAVTQLERAGLDVAFDDIVVTANDPPQLYGDSLFVASSATALRELDSTTRAVSTERALERLYCEVGDEFDIVFVVLNLSRGEAAQGFLGSTLGVSNAVEGIGRPIFDSSSRWGSDGKLQSITTLVEHDGVRNGPMLHEIIHRWAADITVGSGSHWGFSSANGQLGGFDLDKLAHLGGTQYSAGSFSTLGYPNAAAPYSLIELYLAGLVPPEDVPDLWVARNGQPAVDSNGELLRTAEGDPIFEADGFDVLSIEDIVSRHGARSPGVADSQKSFRGAVVLLIDESHPATRKRLDSVTEDIEWFSFVGNDSDTTRHNFYEATGGRATMNLSGLETLSRQRDYVGVSFDSATYGVAEGDDVLVTVRLSADPERTVVVPLTAEDRGGASSADYSGVPASVVFTSGDPV